ncbi:DUF6931 family protein [Planctomycetaceae bacterium SH139]
MSILLTAELPDHTIKRLTLRPEQRARVGGSPWLEMCLGDPLLAGEHFEVRYTSAPEIVCLDAAVQLTVAGQQVSRIPLGDQAGAELIFHAGATKFQVNRLTNEIARNLKQNAGGGDSVLAEALSEEVLSRRRNRWQVLATEMKLSESAQGQIAHQIDEPGLVNALCQQELLADAVRLTLRLLTPEQACRIVWQEVHDKLAFDPPFLQTLNAWLDAPEEARRVAIVSAIEEHQWEGCQGYLAAAVQFSSGSLAPVGQPVVVPPPHLTALALDVALKVAVVMSTEVSLNRVVEQGVLELSASE